MQLVPELAHAAYDEGAARIGAELEQGRDVAVLCEGDPFLYGSFAQLFERLGERYRDRGGAGRGVVHRCRRRRPHAAGRPQPDARGPACDAAEGRARGSARAGAMARRS